MSPPPQETIEARTSEQLARIVQSRLPVALGGIVVTFTLVGVFEAWNYPERIATLLVAYPASILLMAIGIAWARRPSTPPSRAVGITVACLVFYIAAVTVYFVLVHGHVELLALALVYLVVGSMVTLPWGTAPQATVVGAAVAGYCAATILDLPTATPRSIHFIGMLSMAALTIASARALARYHLDLMRRGDEKDTLLEIARDLTGNVEIEEILAHVQQRTAMLLSCDIVATYFIDRAAKLYRLKAQCGVPADMEEMARAVGVPVGESVFQTELLWQKQPLIFNDPTAHRALRPEMLRVFGVQALLIAPLFLGQKTLGFIVAVHRHAATFGPPQVELLDSIARQLSIAIEAAEHDREQRDEAEVSAALARVGRELISSLDTPVVLERLCRVSAGVLGCDTTHAFLRDEASGAFVVRAGHGDSPEFWESFRGTQVPTAEVELFTGGFRDQDVVRLGDPTPDPSLPPLRSEYGIRSALCIALRRGDELVGLLSAGRREIQPFSEREVRIAGGIAQLASLSLENARLVEELDDANRVKSDFVANMSHELRTPLNVIIGYNDLLAEEAFGGLAGEQRDIVDRVGKRARELLELVNVTLDLSRVEAGDVPLALREVQVGQLFRDLDLETRLMRLKPQVAMHWETAADLPPLVTDAAKLRVVLRNLVVNAVKFTDEGTIRVHAVPSDGGVEVAVADTGIGIPAEMLEAIFQPFRQVDGTPGRSGGVGLGLHLVRRLLDMLGGRVSVESRLGQGSTFRVWMPTDGGNRDEQRS